MSFSTCYGTGVPSYPSVAPYEPQQPLDPPDYPEQRYFCPCCDKELDALDEVYTSGGEILGCKYCIERKDAEDILNE